MNQLYTLLFLFLLLFPGLAFVGRLRRDYPQISSVGRWAIVLLISLVHISLFSFLLAFLGIFNSALVWLFSLLATLIYGIRLRPRRDDFPSLFENRREVLVAATLLLIGYFSFPPPSEWLTNYHMDAGRYSNAAGFILHKGGYVLENTLPPYSQELEWEDYNSFPGMFMASVEDRYVPPYVHLYPVLQALYRAHVGVYQSYTFNWILGLGASLLLYTLISVVSGSQIAATLGSLLYFTNGACQLYFMRNFTETISTLLFLGLGLLMWCFEKRSSHLLAIFVALIIALLALCRLEVGILYILIPGIFGMLMLFTSWKPPKHYTTFLVAHLALLLPLTLYYHYHTNSYVYLNTRQNIGMLFHSLGYHYKSFRPYGHLYWFGFSAAVLALNILLYQFGRRIFEIKFFSTANADKRFSIAVSFAFGLWLTYAATLRPYLASLHPESFHHDTINLARLFYFVDPIIWILAIFGLYPVLKNKDFRFFAFFVAVMTTLTLFASGHSPTLFFWVRRYVPLVIPGMIILAAFTLGRLPLIPRYALFALCMLFNVFTTRALVHGYVEKEGVYAHFEKLAKAFEKNAVQICLNGDYCNKSAVPLQTHFNIESFYMNPGLNRRKIKFVKKLLKSGRPVYFTFSNIGGATFTEEEKQMLHRAHLTVEPAAAGDHVAPMLMGLEDEWGPQYSWANLYYPRVLLGERRFAGRRFPATIVRLRLQRNAANHSN